MAIAWVLRDQRVTSAFSSARATVEQLDDSLEALEEAQVHQLAELKEIDRHAQDGDL